MTTTQRTPRHRRDGRRPASSLEVAEALAGMYLEPMPRFRNPVPGSPSAEDVPARPSRWGRIAAVVVALAMIAIGGYQIADGEPPRPVVEDPAQVAN